EVRVFLVASRPVKRVTCVLDKVTEGHGHPPCRVVSGDGPVGAYPSGRYAGSTPPSDALALTSGSCESSSSPSHRSGEHSGKVRHRLLQVLVERIDRTLGAGREIVTLRLVKPVRRRPRHQRVIAHPK